MKKYSFLLSALAIALLSVVDMSAQRPVRSASDTSLLDKSERKEKTERKHRHKEFKAKNIDGKQKRTRSLSSDHLEKSDLEKANMKKDRRSDRMNKKFEKTDLKGKGKKRPYKKTSHRSNIN